jgi:ABC-2 type transport system ATP-binding protein
VLILDEPTSGLDPNQLLEIRNLIHEIGRTKTVIMSTHIMQEVEAICSRAIIIHKGHIVADDTTQNLQHMATAKSIIMVEFNTPVDGAVLKKIPGVIDVNVPAESHPPSSSWHLTAAPGIDIRADVFKFAVDHKLTVLSLQREEQKLEEVFQELTRN